MLLNSQNEVSSSEQSGVSTTAAGLRLGIMQPYFLPYLGYYSLIKHTDKWIVFDTVQFMRHGWIERNRILKPVEGWQYISIPLEKHGRHDSIKDIKIRTSEDWRTKIFRQIDHYKKAPYYTQTIEMLRHAFSADAADITMLNVAVLQATCNYLDIAFDYKVFSQMDIETEPVSKPGDWALHISKALNAAAYINPPGGVEIFDKEKFDEAGIRLSFLSVNLKEYSQRRTQFEPGLSILDVMMFNSPSDISLMLNDVTLF